MEEGISWLSFDASSCQLCGHWQWQEKIESNVRFAPSSQSALTPHL